MRPAKDRPEAIARFWDDVKDLLTQDHGHPPWRAQQGIEDYRQEVDRRELGEVVYNQGEEQVARVIDGVIRDGKPTP